MGFRDVRSLSEAERWARADRARVAHNIPGFPELAYFNSSTCPEHAELNPLCMQCGIVLRFHQRVGIVWLYLAKRGLLGDSVGTGKTPQVAGVLAMCKETGELQPHGVVIVCKAAAIMQWEEQLHRLVPGITVATAVGTKRKRLEIYQSWWEVILVGPEILLRDRDALMMIDPEMVVYDDIDPMRHHSNKTAAVIKKLCERAERVIGIHGTPLQKRLPELHSFLEPVGGREVFGSERAFRFRYIVKEPVKIWSVDDRTGRRASSTTLRDVALKNVDEFKRLVAPLVLRRTAADIDDVTLPAIQPNVVWLDPSPQQAERYAQLRQGVLHKIKEEGEQISRPAAVAQFTHGWQICSGLASLDQVDSEGASVKLDWVADKVIDGDLSEEKVVAFVYFRPNVEVLSRRLTAAGIGNVIMWSAERDPVLRHERVTRFRDDPDCRVLIGTTTIEQSLNLQVSRHLVGVDTILNPARMEQIVGRIRRDGSVHSTVYFHQLFLRGTQEDYYLQQLEREQAMSDYIWDERSEIFNALSPLQLMQMIAGR